MAKNEKRQFLFHSIQTKLLTLFFSFFLILMAMIIILSEIRLTAIAEECRGDLYRERLDLIINELGRAEYSLRYSGEQATEERKELQKTALENIKDRYYLSTSPEQYPFIIDPDIIVTLHPTMAEGTDNRRNIPWSGNFETSREGDFTADYFGTKKWYLYKWFAPWDWIICYTVPIDVVYRDVRLFQKSLVFFMILIKLIFIPLIITLILNITGPLAMLTDITWKISRGDLGQSIPVKGKGEIGDLEKSIKTMQDSIKQKIEAMNREMRDKTIMKEQLAQSQKLDAIGQLAGGVAHDFNNILTGISGAAQLLAGLHDDEESRIYTNMIIQSADSAAELTAKLLAFGRKSQLLKRSTDLHALIRDTLLILDRTLDKKISLHLSLKANPSHIWCDTTAIQNGIINIATNAAHAMGQGGDLTIGTSLRPLSEADCRDSSFDLSPGYYAELSIADTGTGIPPEHLDKIFEPFFTTKEKDKGTGLGLASVYGTVMDHKGAITVKSTPGEGTEFKLLLPCPEAKD